MASTTKRGPGFHHIAISAFDFDKTVNFYIEGIGCKSRYTWGAEHQRAAMLDLGDGNYIEVFEGRANSDDIPEGGILHYALRVPSCDDAYANAVSAGAMTMSEPTDVDMNGEYRFKIRIAFVRGLDGEVIEFFENDQL